MVQVELGTELEEQLVRTAEAKGLSLDAYLKQELEAKHVADDLSDEEKETRRHEAVDRLLNFSQTHRFTLGPDLTIKDLINEGRRF